MKYVIIYDGIVYKVKDALAKKAEKASYSPDEEFVQEVISEIEKKGKRMFEIYTNLNI